MRSPFVTGLLHPINLLMLGACAFAGLVAAWWLFPLGLVLWLIMVLAVARDPSLRISHQMQTREPLAQRFQTYFDRIERAQVSVFNSLASAPSNTRRVLQPVQDQLDALTSQAYALCQRMTALENYRLVQQSSSNLQSDLARTNDAIDNATDQLVKEQYEESRRSLLERLAKQNIVSSELERVEAQLLSLASELDGVVTEVVRLQAVGANSASDRVPALVDKLHQESKDLQAFADQISDL